MYYLIYSITNIQTGKLYIGAHKTSNIDDGYMGSGKYIKTAIAKYGRDSFKKEILFVCNTAEEMYAKEAELVTEDFLITHNTYNLKVGGSGFTEKDQQLGSNKGAAKRKFLLDNDPNWVQTLGEKISAGLKRFRESSRNKNRIGSWTKGKPGTMLGKIQSQEAKEKISESKRGTGTRGNNSKAVKVQDDYGHIFDCLLDCADFHGINKETVRYRIKTGKYTKL